MSEGSNPIDVATDEGHRPLKPKQSRRTKLLTAGVAIVVLAGLGVVAVLMGLVEAVLFATGGSLIILLGLMIWALLTTGR